MVVYITAGSHCCPKTPLWPTRKQASSDRHAYSLACRACKMYSIDNRPPPQPMHITTAHKCLPYNNLLRSTIPQCVSMPSMAMHNGLLPTSCRRADCGDIHPHLSFRINIHS